MYTDNTYGLAKEQEANLAILKEIDRICKKHNIDYALDSGTLIGAVRENGFIPWDDDADIAMTRQAWNAFRKAAAEDLDEGMKFMTPELLAEDNEFFDFTAKLTSKEDSLRWVDIFVQDNLPDHFVWWTKFRQKVIYLLAMGHRQKLDYSKYSLFHKIAVGIVSTIGKLFNMKTLCRWHEKVSTQYNDRKTKNRYYSDYQPDYLYVTLKTEWTEKFMSHVFEDFDAQIPVYYDNILKIVYGDYMTPPKEANRIPKHENKEIEDYEKK